MPIVEKAPFYKIYLQLRYNFISVPDKLLPNSMFLLFLSLPIGVT